MLLQFIVQGYKSFVQKTSFSLVPAPRQKGHDYSILSEKIGRKEKKALSASVIYGPNAAGKSNLIGAISTMRTIVLRGHLKNASHRSNPNVAEDFLELVPNAFSKEKAPVLFDIEFTDTGTLLRYVLEADLGTFLDTNYSRQIIKEQLYVNEEIIYERLGNQLTIADSSSKARILFATSYLPNSQTAKQFAEESLRADELFLNNGFKTIVSPVLAQKVLTWFEQKLFVIFKANASHYAPNIPKEILTELKNVLLYSNELNEAVNIFGVTSNQLAYQANQGEQSVQLVSVFKDVAGHSQKIVPSQDFESYGTVRFADLFPIIAGLFSHGVTIVVDELDASIHPMAIMNLLTIFHNDEINLNKSQLIFNTQNPIFLTPSLLRRDEIHFIERDDKTQQSTHYTLADFGTAGTNGVRRNEDYLSNYFVNRYGAIRSIDFSDCFRKLIQKSAESHEGSKRE